MSEAFYSAVLSEIQMLPPRVLKELDVARLRASDDYEAEESAVRSAYGLEIGKIREAASFIRSTRDREEYYEKSAAASRRYNEGLKQAWAKYRAERRNIISRVWLAGS